MQQTEKYKLNLIEKDDVFSPDALNENMEKVEAQLDNLRTEAAAEADALDQRLQAIEAHKLVIGHASSESTMEYLGFTPRLLYVLGSSSHMLVIEGRSSYSGIRVEEDSFYHNGSYANCLYVAFT